MANAFDQTGAAWTSLGSNTLLGTDDPPGPVFGARWFSTADGETWTRNSPQSNPVIPDDFTTFYATSLQIDLWGMQTSADDFGNTTIRLGAPGYPFNSTFQLSILGDAHVGNAFITAEEESFGISLNPLTLSTWTHLRLLCTGNTVRLYINGVEDVAARFTTVNGFPIAAVNPISLMQIEVIGAGVFIDEVRAALDVGTSTANFTPPVAPWPNPT